jgi:hypothetical protein
MALHILIIIKPKWCITLNLKTMKPLTLMLISAMMLFSCQKEKEAMNLDAGIEITVFDNNGNDLLNPSNQNSFKEQNIKIYYLINGIVEEVYYPNYDNPRNFSIYERDGIYRMGLSPNANEKDEFPVTYIKWNETDTDTIKCSISRTESSVICTKVWYNETLMWDDYSSCRCIQVVK